MTGWAKLAALVAVFGAVACGSTVEQKDLTGVDLTVRFDSALSLEELAISGTIDGDQAFAPGILPETPRPLDPAGETLVILVDPALAGMTVSVQADGMQGGQILATGAVDVTLVGKQLVRTAVMLGPPPECGDGDVAEGFEACDDGDKDAGDGCNGQCEIEAGWDCSNDPGQPSLCERMPACDDGIDNDQDGLTDFAGGDDGCSSAADDSEEGSCAAACAANSQCSETCQHDECGWTCNETGCGCELDCNEAATSCDLACTGNTCGLQCDNSGACSASCTSSADCTIDCQQSASCDASCTMSSSCDINCDGADVCAATCTNGSSCVLHCGDSPDCGFAQCQAGGGAQSCPNNVYVCGRMCP